MKSTVELRFREHDWDRLVAHLFPGDADEHGAALLCGVSGKEGAIRLLVREVAPATDGVDYVPGVRGYRHLDGAFVTRHLRRAKDLGLAYLAVHNHGGHGQVAFSGDDLNAHQRAYPTLLAVNREAVGGLVVARDAVAGDLWLTDGTRQAVTVTTIVGDGLTQLTDGTTPDGSGAGPLLSDPTRSRQAMVFGETGQRLLAGLTVGVVGAGGVGMLIIQVLARLGVGSFIVVDPDVVSPSNLSRLPEARRRDAYGLVGGRLGRVLSRVGFGGPATKVSLAKRVITTANAEARVAALRRDVADDDVARKLRACDFIFLAADTNLARDVVNQIAYQYLIPTLQVGSKVQIDGESGNVLDIFGVVRSLGSTPGCLRCNGLVDAARLTEESLASEEQRRNQRYVDDPGIDAPSVITINAMSVGWAVNDFMQYATKLGRPADGFRILRSRPVGRGPQLTVQHPNVDDDCHVCGLGTHSALSRGDAVELPTRLSGGVGAQRKRW
jgi:hypothetical protein